MKQLLTILLIFLSLGAMAQETTTKIDTLRIPIEILIDKAVTPEKGVYPYPRPVESYDGVEIQFRENEKIKNTLFFIALIDPQTGELKYTRIDRTNFKTVIQKK